MEDETALDSYFGAKAIGVKAKQMPGKRQGAICRLVSIVQQVEAALVEGIRTAIACGKDAGQLGGIDGSEQICA